MTDQNKDKLKAPLWVANWTIYPRKHESGSFHSHLNVKVANCKSPRILIAPSQIYNQLKKS